MTIEIVFGLMKRQLRTMYTENSKIKLEILIATALNKFKNKNMTDIYLSNGRFDPTIGLQNYDNGKVEELFRI